MFSVYLIINFRAPGVRAAWLWPQRHNSQGVQQEDDVDIDIPQHTFNPAPAVYVCQIVAGAKAVPLRRVGSERDRLLRPVRRRREILRRQYEVDGTVAHALLAVQPQLRLPRGVSL